MRFRCLGQIISDLFLMPNSQFDPLGRSIMVSLTSEEIDIWIRYSSRRVTLVSPTSHEGRSLCGVYHRLPQSFGLRPPTGG